MADIYVLGGDFPKATGAYGLGSLRIKTSKLQLLGVEVSGLLVSVEVLSARSRKSVMDAIGLGAVVSLAFGNVGAMAGLILGGNKKEVSFVSTLADGRRFVARAKPKVVDKLAALAMRNARAFETAANSSARSQAPAELPDASIPMKPEPADNSIPMESSTGNSIQY